ncbi:uncharacterized protein [Spinacia oleracea]|uniref:Retrotransposon Copia-like N-terminal domain-containing protein n=1 Tax=Spinacia oleracea TaxID=3562 RepID=A0A9R0I047_SPIOL|nr:uncharacterized protein LOC110780068 [Spinacia oleracea]
MADSKFHPALAVSNIKNHVSIVLEMETDNYEAWVELFKLHARSHRVLAHIIPPADGKEPPRTTKDEKELWSTLDAIVLQWIYVTISTGLFLTVIEPDSTAMEAWDRLRELFQDNCNSCALAIEHDFSHVKMRDYPNVPAYCQRLKSLSDQLKSIGAPDSGSRLVLQRVLGLSEAYKTVGTNIRQSKPLPSFTESCSSLRLEEKALAEMYEDSQSAMVAASSREFDDSPSYGEHSGHNKGRNKHSKGHNSGKKNGGGGRGNGGGKSGRGGGGRGNGGNPAALPVQ